VRSAEESQHRSCWVIDRQPEQPSIEMPTPRNMRSWRHGASRADYLPSMLSFRWINTGWDGAVGRTSAGLRSMYQPAFAFRVKFASESPHWRHLRKSYPVHQRGKSVGGRCDHTPLVLGRHQLPDLPRSFQPAVHGRIQEAERLIVPLMSGRGKP